MTDGTMFLCTIMLCIWIGWPIHSIASEMTRLRKLAERGRR